MATRPYSSLSFEELNNLFEKNGKDYSILENLKLELSHRKKNRKAPALKKKLEKAMESYENTDKKNKDVVLADTRASYDSKIHETGPKPKVEVPENWEPEQRTVIELDEDETKIVEAGPGAGKTAVACARVVYLIEECGLEASKIFLISFTRTAVKEIRDRIEAFSRNPISVAGLQIFTLDSFTWQVLRGLGSDDAADLLGGYETNIRTFIQQLKDRDPKLLDYLEEFEHVILDEGQDLVSDRADLAIQIIRNLEEGCGVTIFSDSAQAIYGFTDDSEEHGTHRSLTVVERILAGELAGFERKILQKVHRTRDPGLTRLFTEGRERLLDRKKSDYEGWLAMKQLITDCAHGSVGVVDKQELAGKSDHLILFRTRAEVLIASSFLWGDGVVHKLRMSGITQRVLPWIGRLLGEVDQNYLDKEQFLKLWQQRIQLGDQHASQTSEQAWQLLLDNVGDNDQRIRVVRLREMLTRDRPPIDFLIDESRLAGPVLGTIHASKGREASQVNLMLPPDEFMVTDPESSYALSAEEVAEEERVLFVGATRAKNRLFVGKGRKMYASRYKGRRIYKMPRGGHNRRLVEIGLNGDLDLNATVDGRLGEQHQELQDWLWQHSNSKVELEARYDHDLNANVLFAVEHDLRVGILSQSFNRDLWGITKIVGEKAKIGKLHPGMTIKNIRMVGTTTVAIPEAQRESMASPWRHSGFLLAPVITGFPLIYFNQIRKG